MRTLLCILFAMIPVGVGAADVINRTANADTGIYRFIKSVNTPDFSTADWLINPNLSSVVTVPMRHWKVVGNTVVEMTTAEKNFVDRVRKPPERKAFLKSPDGSVWELQISNIGIITTLKR